METFTPLHMTAEGDLLGGMLVVPERAVGLVVMPQPGPRGHQGPRANFLARQVRAGGFATLVCDLVGPDASDSDSPTPASTQRLATRLEAWLDVMRQRAAVAKLPLGCVASGSVAGAAVLTAVRHPGRLRALVTYAGRLELAWPALPELDTATLMLAGEHDAPVVKANRHALRRIRHTRRFEIIPGAHHRFEEPGALHRVAALTRAWMRRYLMRPDEWAPGAVIDLVSHISTRRSLPCHAP